jgi:4'-phosphopantetheinyl transferase
MPSLALPENAVHVWYARLPKTLAELEVHPGRAASYRALLASEEHARLDRFVQQKDRCQYLLGKVLVRTTLSRYLPCAPEQWAFATNRFGKPVLANSPEQPAPRFNLAHTEGLAACVVARDFDVGIDVENLGRSTNLDIARRYFAPAEVAYLEERPESEQHRVFFVFWTLKEAYVKARGMGLSLPLEQFAFDISDQTPSIAFDPTMREDPTHWQFFLPTIGLPDHQAAVAVHCPKKTQIDLVVRSVSLFAANEEQG